MKNNTSVWTILSVATLIIFTAGMLKNLGNIAFWEDEGETVQYGKTILKFGYPSVFDGRSFFIIEPDLYRQDNFARYPSPWLQFYIAAAALKLTNGISDTFLIRLPFSLFAIAGIWLSWLTLKKFKYPPFVIFLYSFFISTSVQLYLYWRQARHYALQFPLLLGVIFGYLRLNSNIGKLIFILSSILLYYAYYPGFFAAFAGISFHLFFSRLLKIRTETKSFILSSVLIAALTLPAYIYLHHYQQVPGDSWLHNLTAYFYDYNYIVYTKILFLSAVVIVFSARKRFAVSLRNFWLSGGGFSSVSACLIAIAPLVLSFGRHNARYLSMFYPIAMILVAVGWDNFVLNIKHKRQNLIRFLSLAPLIFMISWSHPQFFLQLQSFIQELNSAYLGPIEGAVNTITNLPAGKIDAYLSRRPELLIATNFEESALYSYLDSQFLSVRANGKYKFGDRLPDWLIKRREWGEEDYFQKFIDTGKYQKIETDYCDLQYQQTYLVRTHKFKTVADCPDQRLILYKRNP